jgi:ribonuclease HI
MDRLRVLRAAPLLAVVVAGKKQVSLVAYVDGAARGNPGPAAAGVVIEDSDGGAVKTLSVAIGNTTNNVAEYAALVLAMQEALMLGAKELRIYTDSELIAKQWSGDYRIKDASLKVLYLLASHLKQGFRKLEVSHVPRERNKLADREANRALNRQDLF